MMVPRPYFGCSITDPGPVFFTTGFGTICKAGFGAELAAEAGAAAGPAGLLSRCRDKELAHSLHRIVCLTSIEVLADRFADLVLLSE